MKTKLIALLLIATTFCTYGQNESELKKIENEILRNPLPSWNAGATKTSILEFVKKTTKKGSPDYVAVEDRIACFDNDGTLWAEQPFYSQLFFALDQVKLMAPQHPEWKTTQPFQAVLEGDMKTVLAGGEKAVFEIVAATHSGMDTDTFNKSVKTWIATAKHPKFDKLYTQMIYTPMVELLKYLRANGYKTFIVSGGGVDFMRPWTEETYGIPPYQVVGSSVKVAYDTISKPKLMKQPAINFIDDKAGKPVGIYQFIGKKPIFTVGNSDGDYEMMQWTNTATTPHFAMFIHHTDAVREWAYDRDSKIGHLSVGLDNAKKYGFVIMDMKNDWLQVFPFQTAEKPKK
ncbi:HAD family hydrolase [Flavobacterium sp. N3904]|uniref:HAD family hydrolase n=1 Tax=Flavobacterium sp. N3904 TaxID=2986835 RepID=UPI0022248A09|nr:HAD family hydrolase [Flavobacterium sp. N3904]